MVRSTVATPPREADGGLEALLRVEEELAEALEIARSQAGEILEEARREAEALRRQRAVELEDEVAAVEAAAGDELQRRLAELATERRATLERYRIAMEDELDELAEWTIRRLLADLEEPPP